MCAPLPTTRSSHPCLRIPQSATVSITEGGTRSHTRHSTSLRPLSSQPPCTQPTIGHTPTCRTRYPFDLAHRQQQLRRRLLARRPLPRSSPRPPQFVTR